MNLRTKLLFLNNLVISATLLLSNGGALLHIAVAVALEVALVRPAGEPRCNIKYILARFKSGR